jgi:hypothetical protein
MSTRNISWRKFGRLRVNNYFSLCSWHLQQKGSCGQDVCQIVLTALVRQTATGFPLPYHHSPVPHISCIHGPEAKPNRMNRAFAQGVMVVKIGQLVSPLLNIWPRNFLLNFSTPCIIMLIIQKPNKVALWNKRQLWREKTEIMQHV